MQILNKGTHNNLELKSKIMVLIGWGKKEEKYILGHLS